MGHKQSKSLPRGITPDSNEYWEYEMSKTLAPVESYADFITRFNVHAKEYEQGRLAFLGFREVDSDGNPLRPYITYQEWARHSTKETKAFDDLIWKAFDVNGDNRLSFEEFLVYYGITKFGTVNQQVMGSFAMCDLNHDKKIDRKELKYVLQVKMAAGGKPLSDDDADYLVGVFFSAADTDHSETIEVGEMVRAAAKSERIASMFRCI